jgi:glutamyl-tRNA synthetase
MSVRVRFAPSPTGTLHVGSARTALFNWLYARHNKGTFILRIEDTDAKRSNPAFVKDILESLKYLGIDTDEGPIYQSQRSAIYNKYAEVLLASGKAVKQENAVIFNVPHGEVVFSDLIHGDIRVDTNLFENLVLIKSDGTPTYNFACVVDDADMKITHIIRGDDHIANTPKQVVLYKALGFEVPKFAHIPLIVGADRARLSKRQGATAVAEYSAVGYLPEAFVNYLALLGWSPGGNREMVAPLELVSLFEIERVRKTAAQFDQPKLDWLNSQYIRKSPIDRIAKMCAARLIAKGLLKEGYDHAWLCRIITLLQDRLKVLEDLEEENSFFFLEKIEYQQESVDKFLKSPGVGDNLRELIKRLEALPSFDAPSIEAAARGLVAERTLAAKDLIHPARVAITGRGVSPPLFETMSILGKEKVISRLKFTASNLAA